MTDMSMHRLRHWFATVILDEIGDIRVVQELLGHANVSTTGGYTRVAGRKKRAAVNVLPTFATAAVADER
jgi:integrase/recombinase XerC